MYKVQDLYCVCMGDAIPPSTRELLSIGLSIALSIAYAVGKGVVKPVGNNGNIVSLIMRIPPLFQIVNILK